MPMGAPFAATKPSLGGNAPPGSPSLNNRRKNVRQPVPLPTLLMQRDCFDSSIGASRAVSSATKMGAVSSVTLSSSSNAKYRHSSSVAAPHAVPSKNQTIKSSRPPNCPSKQQLRRTAAADGSGDSNPTDYDADKLVEKDARLSSCINKFGCPSKATSTLLGGQLDDDTVSTMASLSSREEETADPVARIFTRIDKDGSGSISKLKFISAAEGDPTIAAFLLPGTLSAAIFSDDEVFDSFSALFDAIAGGRKRLTFSDFAEYYGHVEPPNQLEVSREKHRVLIIQPGLGSELNAYSAAMRHAGFEVRWPSNLPDPTTHALHVKSQMEHYLGQIRSAIINFQPNLVVCARNGYQYLLALWQSGPWHCPVVILGAHPSCTRLPQNVRVIVAHGSNDMHYQRNRDSLEQLMSTGSENSCFLYYAGSGGQLAASAHHRAREGDSHQLESLSKYDCLPRLADAALVHECPDVHFLRTGLMGQLAPKRLAAERRLGLLPKHWRRNWSSQHWRGRHGDASKATLIVEVMPESNEFADVEAIARAIPRDPSHYSGTSSEAWTRQFTVVGVERVENGVQLNAAQAYCEALKDSLEDQGVSFEPGLHTRWTFHGTEAGTAEAIFADPVGFRPLTSGLRAPSVWGSGTYLARDAKYIADGQFCEKSADGSRRMIMCLAMTGVPCLGDADHRGVLPIRKGWHRYNSSVDSLSNPEMHVIQYSGAVCAAYLITYKVN